MKYRVPRLNEIIEQQLKFIAREYRMIVRQQRLIDALVVDFDAVDDHSIQTIRVSFTQPGRYVLRVRQRPGSPLEIIGVVPAEQVTEQAPPD